MAFAGTTRLGAYGLTLPDLAGAAELLVAAPDDWPRWRIRRRLEARSPGVHVREEVSPERATLRLSGAGRVEIESATSTSTLFLPREPDDAEIAHPYLALTAATAARWRGWFAFHAGAVLIGDGAWGILGDKGAGKSATLTWLSLDSSAGVVADDVLVVDPDGWTRTGPRCLDLREDVAAALGVGEPIGVVGARARWRLRIGDVPPQTPLRGWVVLEWGQRLQLQELLPSEAFEAIARNMSLRLLPPDARGLIGLAGLPSFRLVRPRSFDCLADAGALLLARLRR